MDLFSDDENSWNGNEENEHISIESFDESIQSDELTSNDESAGEETPRKKSRKIAYKEVAKFDSGYFSENQQISLRPSW